MNKVQVLEKIDPAIQVDLRTIAHRPQTQVIINPNGAVFRPGGGARHIEVTPDGLDSMTSFIGIPKNVGTGLRPETLGHVTTELLARKGDYALALQDGAVTAVGKPGGFRTVNADRVLTAVEQGIRGADFHRVLMLDNFVVSLEVVGERREPVKRGDLIQAGANITFSPMGTVNPSVQAYALRCVCTNGIVSAMNLREFRFSGGRGGSGEGDDIWQWFRESSRLAYNSIDKLVAQFRLMMNENIPAGDRASMLESMLAEAGITGETAIAIRAMAIESPPTNSYQLMNLMTNATSHLIENPPHVRRAQLKLSEFTSSDEHSRICPVCRHKKAPKRAPGVSTPGPSVN